MTEPKFGDRAAGFSHKGTKAQSVGVGRTLTHPMGKSPESPKLLTFVPLCLCESFHSRFSAEPADELRSRNPPSQFSRSSLSRVRPLFSRPFDAERAGDLSAVAEHDIRIGAGDTVPFELGEATRDGGT
jgi:hypothetical protein